MKLSKLLLSISLTVGVSWGADALQAGQDERKAASHFLEEVLKGKVDSLQDLVGSADFKSMLTNPHSSIESIYKKTATLKELERVTQDIERLVKLHMESLTQEAAIAVALDLINDKPEPDAGVNEDSASDAHEESDDDNSDAEYCPA